MSKLQKASPGFEEALDSLKLQIFSSINCVQIGKIEKYTKGEQSAEIKIVMQARKTDGTFIDYPVLVDCPVFVLQGGGAYLDMPIAVGDYCIVLFNDRDIDNWWTTGSEKEPNTRRKHDLSDGIALVGLNTKSSPLDLDGSFVRLLGPSGAGAEQPAARQEDPVSSTIVEDSGFWTWVTQISAAVNALAPGSVTPVPTSLSSKIQTGSTEVKIG